MNSTELNMNLILIDINTDIDIRITRKVMNIRRQKTNDIRSEAVHVLLFLISVNIRTKMFKMNLIFHILKLIKKCRELNIIHLLNIYLRRNDINQLWITNDEGNSMSYVSIICFCIKYNTFWKILTKSLNNASFHVRFFIIWIWWLLSQNCLQCEFLVHFSTRV